MAIPKATAKGQNPAYRSSLDLFPEGGLILASNFASMGYFRSRAKPMAIGFLIGLGVGALQPYIMGLRVPEPTFRIFLALQMGAAFAIMGLFVSSYLDMRRKIHLKYGQQSTKVSDSSPSP